jgi:hypothetical protein
MRPERERPPVAIHKEVQMSSTLKLSTESLQLLINNLQDRVSKTAFPANGKTYTPVQVVGLAAQVVAAREAVQTAKGTVTAAKDKVEQTESTNLPILATVRANLVGYLASDPESMAAVGHHRECDEKTISVRQLNR